jgi:thiamine monophosphate synthase
VDNPAPPIALPLVHAVTNDEIVAHSSFIDRARAIMRATGPRGAVHLRATQLARNQPARLLELALTLVEEQERTGAWLVVNDRVDLALVACARGVQLTARSLEVSDAVQVILGASARAGNAGTFITAVGASVHSLEEGIAARLAGAAWGVASDVLGTQQPAAMDALARGDSEKPSDPALLERLVRYAGIPIIAIGGILPQHVSKLRRAGAYGVAAIRGVWDVDHPEHAVIDYLSAYDTEVGR